MIIHQRKIAYSSDYQRFFETLMKAKHHVEKRYPEVSVEVMYNLAGERRYTTAQTRCASLADYERIDAELDRDESYTALLDTMMGTTSEAPVDQFFRIVQSN